MVTMAARKGTSPEPDGDRPELGGRGGRLWESLRSARPFNPAELVVLGELCRMADRLDRLDVILRGDVDTWARLERRYGRDSAIEVVLDDALSEARQLAATFERLAASLKLPEARVEEKDGIDDLGRRRAARLGAG